MIACVGIVDWGIGGVDFLSRFRDKRPGVPVVYLSDTGSPPYGTLSRKALAERLARVVALLARRDVTHLVVACNAASTALDAACVVRATHAARLRAVTGVIAPTLAAVRFDAGATIGVVGGRRTILSRRYLTPLAAAGLDVRQRIAQPLSALVERGELDSPRTRTAIARVFLGLPKLDALVLGCTHYVALAPLFRAHHQGPVVDPTRATLAHVLRTFGLHAAPSAARPAGSDIAPATLLTTGETHPMRLAARRAFGVRLGPIQHVTL